MDSVVKKTDGDDAIGIKHRVHDVVANFALVDEHATADHGAIARLGVMGHRDVVGGIRRIA